MFADRQGNTKRYGSCYMTVHPQQCIWRRVQVGGLHCLKKSARTVDLQRVLRFFLNLGVIKRNISINQYPLTFYEKYFFPQYLFENICHILKASPVTKLITFFPFLDNREYSFWCSNTVACKFCLQISAKFMRV